MLFYALFAILLSVSATNDKVVCKLCKTRLDLETPNLYIDTTGKYEQLNSLDKLMNDTIKDKNNNKSSEKSELFVKTKKFLRISDHDLKPHFVVFTDKVELVIEAFNLKPSHFASITFIGNLSVNRISLPSEPAQIECTRKILIISTEGLPRTSESNAGNLEKINFIYFMEQKGANYLRNNPSVEVSKSFYHYLRLTIVVGGHKCPKKDQQTCLDNLHGDEFEQTIMKLNDFGRGNIAQSNNAHSTHERHQPGELPHVSHSSHHSHRQESYLPSYACVYCSDNSGNDDGCCEGRCVIDLNALTDCLSNAAEMCSNVCDTVKCKVSTIAEMCVDIWTNCCETLATGCCCLISSCCDVTCNAVLD